MKTLSLHLASGRAPVSVRIPNNGQTGDWSADLASMYADMDQLARLAQPEFYGIILNQAGLVLTPGQTAYWDLVATLQTTNPLAEDFKTFLPIIVEEQLTANQFDQYNQTDVDVYVTESPLRLNIKNNSVATKTLYGFVYFPAHRNHEFGIGETSP